MSYFALYRKYRPSTVDDVVGQEYIVQVIKNSLKNNRISHAYMFSGPRGTGKTTMAKILAKGVNCLNPVDGCSCGKCKNCLSISENSNTDIIEIDAASNNGVDEIREIKNKINLVPTDLKYKVYIIDEVHMLSIGAFNALLKTLEEPPEHVIFILATTDIQKVPVTIISRCQCFDFHRLSEKNIIDRLNYIVDKENIKIDSEVINSIANLADGGLRDAIGMLDKVYSYSSDNITIENFEKINGLVSNYLKLRFIKYIENSEVNEIIKFIDEIYNNGKDLYIFYNDLLALCRNLIVDYYMNKSIDYDIEFLLKFVDKFSSYGFELRNTTNIKIVFEIKIFGFINGNINSSTITVDKINLEENNSSTNNTAENKNDNVTKIIEESKNVDSDIDYYKNLVPIIVNNCFAGASKQSLEKLKNDWFKLNDYALDSELGAIACYLVDGTIRAASEKELIITFDYDSMINRGYTNINLIEKMFDKIFGICYNVAIITTEEWNNYKKEFIDNKNKGILYEYKEIPKKAEKKEISKKTISSSDSLTDKAKELFGDDMVSNI